MNPMDIINGLGGIEDGFVMDAAAFRQGKGKLRPVAKKKLWLLAAVIALALLLVGCTVVYVLRLQDLRVGEYRYTAPTVYDENGEAVPVPTHPLQTLLSLQGANQQAFKEWYTYCQEYEQSNPENKQEESKIPEQYRWNYGCHSMEMVNKLDEIASKYDLTLLSPEVEVESYGTSVLFDALGIEKLLETPCDYGIGYFFPEGVFDMAVSFELDNSQWPYTNYADYHYSKKAYFEPNGTVMLDFENTVQWDYTRKDGVPLLLAMNHQQAFIFADSADGFITVSLASFKWDGTQKVQMPQSILEQMAEIIVFSVDPHPADMSQVRQLQASALEAHEEALAQSVQERYTQGYESYIENRLAHASSDYNRDCMFYSLYDLNGDGVPELLPGGKITLWEVLSIRDGESYLYGDLTGLCGFAEFQICENHVIALKEYDSESSYYYLRADATGLTFLEGLWKKGDTWYSLSERPAPNPNDTHKTLITEAQAQTIMASYVPLEQQPERQQMKKWGEPVKDTPWTDPYARYIAEMLERFEDADQFTYALMDLNGDGVEELLTKDVRSETDDLGRPDYLLSVHTIVDGKLVTPKSFGVTGVCENGILYEQNKAGTTYEFYQMNGAEIQSIEVICQDPLDLYWSRFVRGDTEQQGSAFSEEKAKEYIDAYKPISLTMKPFAAYPFG